MDEPPRAPDTSSREADYYHRQLDELAGENIRLDLAISGLRHEIQQKRQGFGFLIELLAAIGTRQQISDIFELSIGTVNSTMGMDRSVVLVPTEEEGCYRPTQWLGFHDDADADAGFSSVSIRFPPDFARATSFLLVNQAAETTPLTERLREVFGVPYFACVPVLQEDGPLALLLAGRLRESRPFYPPLDQGDIDTFQAVAGLISSLLQNRRIAAVEEASRQIREATQRKSRFLASMSHELRTPMNAIVGFTRLVLRQGGDALGERQRGNLAKVVQSSDYLLSLINDLLDLSKVEAGRMEVDAETFDLEALIANCCAEVSPLVGPGVRLSHSVGADVGEVRTDKRRLHQVIINLLSNALKFTDEGQVEVRGSCESIADGRDDLAIAVADTGAGIPAEALDAIFEEFQQVRGSDSQHRGTGLGLPITRGFARLLGGGISVESEPGVGSTFTVRIPKLYEGEAEVAEPEPVEGTSVEASGQPAPATATGAATADSPDALGPAEMAALIHDCARRGQIVAVRDHIDRIEQFHPDLAPLAPRLRQSAASFDMERICQLLQPYVS